MTATPVVSVIIPAYNAAAFILDGLSSATAQTLTEVEIIVVDDVSTDETAALVETAAATDGRIRLIQQPVNGGPSAARNTGIAAAQGTWIALLDADDGYEPDRLRALVDLAERRDADLCSDNLLLVPEDVPSATRMMIPSPILPTARELGIVEFVRRNVADPEFPHTNFGFLKPIMRRAFLVQHAIRYDETVRFAEDFTLYLDCLCKGARWWMSPAPSYHYLVRRNSLTQVQTVHDLGRLRQRQSALLDFAVAQGDVDLIRATRRHAQVVDRSYYYRAFTDAVKSRRTTEALTILTDSRRSAWLIAQESLRQLPIILNKLRRGGYLARPS